MMNGFNVYPLDGYFVVCDKKDRPIAQVERKLDGQYIKDMKVMGAITKALAERYNMVPNKKK